jgi:hypothetical protein
MYQVNKSCFVQTYVTHTYDNICGVPVSVVICTGGPGAASGPVEGVPSGVPSGVAASSSTTTGRKIIIIDEKEFLQPIREELDAKFHHLAHKALLGDSSKLKLEEKIHLNNNNIVNKWNTINKRKLE